MKMKILFCWVPAVLFAALIFTFSSLSNPPGARFFAFIPNSDKIVHMTEYFVLAWLVYSAFFRTAKLNGIKRVLAVLFIVSIYGVSDEFHQYFVPGRSCDFLDWGADTLGATMFLTAKLLETSTKYKVQSTK